MYLSQHARMPPDMAEKKLIGQTSHLQNINGFLKSTLHMNIFSLKTKKHLKLNLVKNMRDW